MKSRIWVTLLVGSLGACASPLTKAKSDNRQLTHTVEELRLERREKDRKLRDLEKQMAELKQERQDRNGNQTLAATDNSVPALHVEVLGPSHRKSVDVTPPAGDSDLGDGGKIVGMSDDGSEIVYIDDALQEPVALEQSPVSNRIHRVVAVTASDERPRPRDRSARVRAPLRPVGGPARSAIAGSNRSEISITMYRDAVALLRSGKHAESIAMLREFIASNPNHDYADNAQYWLGEAFYDQKDYANAVSEFRTTVEKYPQGNKVPDAMLKVGYCYWAMGEASKGESVLAELIRLYPKSEPATLAAKRLESK
jgi:tol-pal system protein YbgF